MGGMLCCKFTVETNGEKSEDQPLFVEAVNECRVARVFLTHSAPY